MSNEKETTNQKQEMGIPSLSELETRRQKVCAALQKIDFNLKRAEALRQEAFTMQCELHKELGVLEALADIVKTQS
jgi:hypothetical protein